MSDFDQFWQAFPRKVGKLAAEREFIKARKRATLEELMVSVSWCLTAFRSTTGSSTFTLPRTSHTS